MPSQPEVDAVAFFVDAAAGARQESFFSGDARPSFRGTWETERAFCVMGDRLHFRSAAIHFQRMWNPADEAHWRKTADILLAVDLPAKLKDAAKWRVETIERELTRHSHPLGIGLNVQHCLELGMNAFVVPSPSDQLHLRKEFEAKAREITFTVLECAFRHDLYIMGKYLIEFSQHGAQPALEWFKKQWGLVPSFEVGLMQRLRRREKTPDGRMMVREGTSEWPHEELFAERYARLLGRDENQQLKQILTSLQASPEDLQRAILRGEGFRSLIKEIEGRIEIHKFPADRVGGLPRQDFLSAGNFDKSTRFCLYHGNFVLVQEGGEEAYDSLLLQFREQLISAP